jgi:ribonuclease HII
MQVMALKYPEYKWDSNMGYPTKKHREAIRTHGVTPIHRLTFQLLPKQLALEL